MFVDETGGAHLLDEKGVREGIEGTLRVLKHLGMKSNIPEVKRETEFYYKSAWVRARHAGLFQPSVVLGDPVTRRQVLGRITDPFGFESFRVVAPTDGRVIGLNNSPVVHKRDTNMTNARCKSSLY